MKKVFGVIWNSFYHSCIVMSVAGLIGFSVFLFDRASVTTGFGAFGLICIGIISAICAASMFLLIGYFMYFNMTGSTDRSIESIKELYLDNNGKVTFKDGYAIFEDPDGYKTFVTELGNICLTFGKPLVYKSESAICKTCPSREICIKRGMKNDDSES